MEWADQIPTRGSKLRKSGKGHTQPVADDQPNHTPTEVYYKRPNRFFLLKTFAAGTILAILWFLVKPAVIIMWPVFGPILIFFAVVVVGIFLLGLAFQLAWMILRVVWWALCAPFVAIYHACGGR